MYDENLKKAAKLLPKRPGVYQFRDTVGTVVYVGKALSLFDRVGSYFAKDVSSKTAQLMQQAKTVTTIETGSELEALILEAKLIKLYKPRYNISQKDDKSYLYVFISNGEEFPKVFFTRKPKAGTQKKGKFELYDGLKGTYFGPFASGFSAKEVLKILRRIVPYCQQKNFSTRACFYHHLGLCNPCPSEIIKLKETQPEEYSHLKNKYQSQLKRLVKLIDGKFKEVISDFEYEMKQLSDEERFEEAAKIRNKLRYFKTLLTRTGRGGSEYLENPNYYFDEQKVASEELRELLAKHDISLAQLEKIECYDVSTLMGNFSSGSMVVFVSGIPEKSLYRRFKIKMDGKPNDVHMMAEMISRRLKHQDWTYPDLFLVDGGKPQVSRITKLFLELKIDIPVIGLAKRFEQIVIKKGDEFVQLAVPRRSKALQLLQAIRDEAHRFSIEYNRLRRRKNLLVKSEM